jgi:dihydroorotate dehydrogenase
MWLDESTFAKRDLFLEKSFVNASGVLGFYPDPHTMPFLDHLGAFITNPISRLPRTPANNRVCISFSGGFLMHTGLANPGVSSAIRQYQHRWAGAPLPIIIHLLVEGPRSLAEMIRKLEGLDNVMAVELGLPPDCIADELSPIMEAAMGELSVVVCLSPEQVSVLGETLVELNPATVHLVEPRGTLPGQDGSLVTGRLYGPAIFPQMLNAAQEVLKTGLPLIVDGGIYEKSQADAFLDLGVVAVGLGGSLWNVNPVVGHMPRSACDN